MDPDAVIAIELARQVLPFWVPWGSAIVVALAALVVALASSWVAGRIALSATRGAAAAPWPERARLIHPAKQAMAASCLASAMLCLALGVAFAGAFSVLPPRALAAVGAAVALAVGSWRYRAVAQRLRPAPIPLPDALRGAATCTLLFLSTCVLLVPAFFAVPARLDGGALAVVALAALAMTAFNCGLGLRLCLAIGLVSPASSRAKGIAAGASARAGVEARACYELHWPSANAIAFPIAGAVGFTDGALAHLSDAELEAICAHELGHLAEGRSALLARALTPAAFAPLVLIVPLCATFGPFGVVPVVLWLIAVARGWAYVSQRLEARADAAARAGVGGETYARALERLYEVNLVPVVLSGATTHPHLYDRMLAAGVEPSYPRPAPPPQGVPRRVLLASLAVGTVLVIGAPASLVAFCCGHAQDPLRVQASLLIPGWNEAPRLATLARDRQKAGDPVAAVKLYRAAAGLDRNPWSAAGHLAMALVLDGHCTNARSLLSGARRGFCPDCGPSDGPVAALTAETAALVCGTPAAATLSSN
jgi:Zn-dependent protease with chaperone function